MLAAAAAGLLWPARARAKKVASRLELAPQLEQVGGFTVLALKGRKILFIRDSATTVRAVSSICTHKHNQLGYNAKLHLIQCPEHGSRFTFDGQVVKGPAKEPLRPIYQAQLDLAHRRVILEL